jgi:hypothetical protein
MRCVFYYAIQRSFPYSGIGWTLVDLDDQDPEVVGKSSEGSLFCIFCVALFILHYYN